MAEKHSEYSKIFFVNFNIPRALSGWTKLPLLFLIRLYQIMISPVLGANCRFYPSCSAYAFQAVKMHGPMKGGWLTAKRVVRCHPFNPGGYDPPPDK